MEFSRSFISRSLKFSLTIRTIAVLALAWLLTSVFTSRPSTAQSGLYVSTCAGVGFSAGLSDGQGPTARFNAPLGLAIDKDDNLIIGEKTRVRKATPAGVVTTLAGNETADWRDAAGTKAMFRSINGLSIDSKGNILASDQYCIRKLSRQ